jgi:hypothetical protein
VSMSKTPNVSYNLDMSNLTNCASYLPTFCMNISNIMKSSKAIVYDSKYQDVG